MEKDQTFQMRHTEAWMQAIDDWRFQQAALRKQDVSKAEAIRELVESGLRAGSDIQEAYDQGYADGAGRRQPRELVNQALGNEQTR